MTNHIISKSTFIRGNQCVKSLYLNKNNPELKDKITPGQQAIFDKGHSVGFLAQQLFPDGIDLKEKYQFDYEKSIEEFQQLINKDNSVIYEAPFLYDEVMSILDMLVCENGKCKAYEVKSSTSISDTYILDSALQYWVIKNSGLELTDFCLVYLNNQYIRKGELDLKQLFVIESVLDRIIPLQNTISEKVEEFKNILIDNKVPDIDIGQHCDSPYTCDFHGYCWQHIPEYSIFNISRLFTDEKFELYKNGIIKFEDIPSDYPLNTKQKQQVECELNQTSIISTKEIQEFLSGLNYPLYFLDFETFQPAVPMFDNSKPYQQMPSQYSLHYLETKNLELKHFEFLAEAILKIDPRIGFIEKLIEDTRTPGDILVYNIAFERTRLLEIAKDFPQYANDIENIVLRLKDLMIPFQNRYFYKPEMRGSYSIKAVLPALVPERSYKDLEISGGGQASASFESLYFENDIDKINSVRKNLLEYCKLDTFAMVKLLQELEKGLI
ncbi:MAG: DUF2779 domain-containing protein [bacterium]